MKQEPSEWTTSSLHVTLLAAMNDNEMVMITQPATLKNELLMMPKMTYQTEKKLICSKNKQL